MIHLHNAREQLSNVAIFNARRDGRFINLNDGFWRDKKDLLWRLTKKGQQADLWEVNIGHVWRGILDLSVNQRIAVTFLRHTNTTNSTTIIKKEKKKRKSGWVVKG